LLSHSEGWPHYEQYTYPVSTQGHTATVLDQIETSDVQARRQGKDGLLWRTPEKKS